MRVLFEKTRSSGKNYRLLPFDTATTSIENEKKIMGAVHRYTLKKLIS
jgi:hypothetical protein